MNYLTLIAVLSLLCIICLLWLDVNGLRMRNKKLVDAFNAFAYLTEVNHHNMALLVGKAQEQGWDMPVKIMGEGHEQK